LGETLKLTGGNGAKRSCRPVQRIVGIRLLLLINGNFRWWKFECQQL
jgi:hypothetical protein